MRLGAFELDRKFNEIPALDKSFLLEKKENLDDYDFVIVDSKNKHINCNAQKVYIGLLDDLAGESLYNIDSYFNEDVNEKDLISALKEKHQNMRPLKPEDFSSKEPEILDLKKQIKNYKEKVSEFREGSIEIKGLREYVTRLMDVNTLEQLVYETEKLRILRYKGIKVSLIFFDKDNGFLCTKNTLRKLSLKTFSSDDFSNTFENINKKPLKKTLANVLARPVLSHFQFRKRQISEDEKIFVLFESDSDFKHLDFFLEMLSKLLFTNFIRVLQSENLYKISSLISKAFNQIQNISILVGPDLEIKVSNQEGAVGKKCYNFIFNQNSPCKECPILKNKTHKSSHDLIDQGYVVYTSRVQDSSEDNTNRYFLHIYESSADTLKRESIKIQRGKLQSLGLVATALTHELNNPLTGIKELSHELSHDFKGQIKEDFEEIEKASKRCLLIIENLKNFSSKKIEFERIEFSKVIYDALTLTKLLTRNTAMDIKLEDNVWISGSSTILSQAVFNIVKNSIEAMSYKGAMSVELYTEDGFAKLNFSDSGPGLPENFKSISLFGTQKKQEGVGYGMFLVSEFVKLHKGHLEFGNNPDHGGAFFLISIPLQV